MAINSGKTIDKLKNEPLLGMCTSIYFNPQKISRVEKMMVIIHLMVRVAIELFLHENMYIIFQLE